MKKELELYVHIPFCIKKCAYCDFLSGPDDERKRQEYINTLIKEIQGYKTIFGEKYEVVSIFIGGGTPSILNGEQLLSIVEALHHSFSILKSVELSIEVNPGTVTREKLNVWKAAGINRLSIGLQSVNNEELKFLGRIHTYEEFLETYTMARKCGFENINIDLISAIPGQTLKSWKQTLSQVAELGAEHISAYSLIIEEGTPFYEQYGKGEVNEPCDQHRPQLPDEEEEREIYEITQKMLKQYGYMRYEISNYAKVGYACRHNLGYWERKEYLGIGLGASSLINHTRYHNASDYTDYISRVTDGEEVREDVEKLSREDEIEEFMFLGLRKTEGISIREFKEKFKKDIADIYGKNFVKLESAGLLQYSGDRICLTEQGINISNSVFIEFLDPQL